MTINNLPGTLASTRYAGSQPINHDATLITSGTLTRARKPLFQTTIVTGTGARAFDTLVKPPGTFGRFVFISVQLPADATSRSGAYLAQRRVGTLGIASFGSADLLTRAAFAALTSPSAGSYMLGSIGNAVTSPSLLFWREYNGD